MGEGTGGRFHLGPSLRRLSSFPPVRPDLRVHVVCLSRATCFLLFANSILHEQPLCWLFRPSTSASGLCLKLSDCAWRSHALLLAAEELLFATPGSARVQRRRNWRLCMLLRFRRRTVVRRQSHICSFSSSSANLAGCDSLAVVAEHVALSAVSFISN
ncbi:hypothetical protein KCU92_g27, partial [Aureobasidium melanogenum]